MTTANQHYVKFEQLLRELFQFDCADLDFGIYRIMNEKREVIEKFIEEDLPGAVAEKLREGSLADQERAAARLAKATEEVREFLGPNTLDGDGNLDSNWHDTPVGKRYLEAKAAGGRSHEALEADLFNHLYAFFSRYYQDGDFTSKRRYSRRERYAIPYNGEEVHLHWANSDQYYVKTAEHFHDYAFTSQGVAVHFQLTAADVEQNNVKGDKRFFLPQTAEIVWEEERSRLVIPFEYRPLTKQEEVAYGGKNPQDAIIGKALTEIFARKGLKVRAAVALQAERRRNGDDKPVSFLEHHLRRYVQRNTSDFFIHKGLKGFLSRELDFYLKNEVLNLDEMQAAGEERAESWFQLVRTIKLVGGRIIDFLDQIERFQKMLWEKRKFVTETQYCITVGNIDESFYPKIAECKAQWQEWQGLLHIHEGPDDLFSNDLKTKKDRVEFLKAHPTLVLDTMHFDSAFTDALFEKMDYLDEKTDGLLIHSENWQALGLLAERYREKVNCIYIDPPYNTGNGGFLYKDSYQHSSWMSMMTDRLVAARVLAAPASGIFVSTDDGEYANLKSLMDQSWGEENFVADVIWNSRKSVSSDTLISLATNHTTFFAANKALLEAGKTGFRLPHSGDKFSNPDNDPRGPWVLDPMDAPNVRENLTYPIVNPATGREFWPPDGRHWRVEKETTERLIGEGRIVFGRNGDSKPLYKRYLSDARERGVAPTTLWDDVKTTTDATRLLLGIFGKTLQPLIDRIKPKPTELIRRCAILLTDEEGVVLDYFAGSGTTGHAVIDLNREDAGRRKFVLAEMGEYFDTVLLPRIKKVTFTPEWKDGKPKRMATQEEFERSPRIVKYLRLESYEDALNNIAFEHSAGQKAIEFDDYLLKYLLAWETKRSETLLNVEKLASPFNYKLRAHANGRAGERAADVPETFNYLLGLRVRTRKVYDDGGRRYLVYRGAVDRRQVAVIWRATEGWQQKDWERDKEFVAEQGFAEGADEVFVNGDSFILGARSLDPVFKDRMFASMEG